MRQNKGEIVISINFWLSIFFCTYLKEGSMHLTMIDAKFSVNFQLSSSVSRNLWLITSSDIEKFSLVSSSEILRVGKFWQILKLCIIIRGCILWWLRDNYRHCQHFFGLICIWIEHQEEKIVINAFDGHFEVHVYHRHWTVDFNPLLMQKNNRIKIITSFKRA